MLAIAGIEHPGTEYRGRDVVPPSGVSLLPYLTGQTETVQRPGSVGYELARSNEIECFDELVL